MWSRGVYSEVQSAEMTQNCCDSVILRDTGEFEEAKDELCFFVCVLFFLNHMMIYSFRIINLLGLRKKCHQEF